MQGLVLPQIPPLNDAVIPTDICCAHRLLNSLRERFTLGHSVFESHSFRL